MFTGVADWKVEVLNDAVETEVLFLPKDMQARFLRISELHESFGPQAGGAATRQTARRKAVGDAFERARRDWARNLCRDGWKAIGRSTRVREENTKTPSGSIDLALRRLKELRL